MDVPSASAPVSYPTVTEQRFHVAWSAQTAFDLDRPKPRMHMYRIVLAEGQLADVTAGPSEVHGFQI